jgi:2'-5' RNA ligase
MAKESSKEGQKYDFGCLMLLVKAAQIPYYADLLAAFDPKDLYESDKAGEFGIEFDPHVTVLYGYHDDATDSYARKVLASAKLLAGVSSIPLTLSGISNFHNPTYDVVKFDVKSPALMKLNAAQAKRFDHTNAYDYHPHLTLAYVQPGKGPEYCKKLWDILNKKPVKLPGTKLMYSRPSGDKIITPL